MDRIAFNVARLNANSRAAREAVTRALEVGVRCFDLNASNAGARLMLKEALLPSAVADGSVRIVARLGYHETREDVQGARLVNEKLSHSLDPSFVAEEAAALASEFGRVSILLHNPEEQGETAKLVDSLKVLRGMGDVVPNFGISTNTPRALNGDWLVALQAVPEATLRRAPACALDGDARRSALNTAARGNELIGYRPFLHVDGTSQRRLIEGYRLTSDKQVEYVEACEAALTHFTIPEDMDDEETIEGCKWIQTLIGDLNEGLGKFASFEQYEHELATQIVPMLHSKFEELDEDSAESLNDFFVAYGATVRRSVEAATRQIAEATPTAAGVGSLKPDEEMAAWAIRRLLARKELSKISVAFEKPEDLDALLKVL